ncbi:MAG: DMT family transporter [Neomegalonema sp.]|nr:DMT family transporter [Neomegalonema sp.]
MRDTANRPDEGRQWLGYPVILGTVSIWAAWILWTRTGVAADYGAALTGADLGVLRFGVPALLLAPYWLRVGLKPAQTSWPVLLAMLGWGAPFVLFAAQGLKSTPVGLMAALVPGLMPLWVALVLGLAFGERYRGARLLGLALILSAALLLIMPSVIGGQSARLEGVPWLLAAGIAWGAFAVSFRFSGLTSVQAAGVVAVWSALICALVAAVTGSKLLELSPAQLGWQVLTQGVLSGTLSVIGYAYAIALLGAARAASFTALVPVLAALMGWAFLGETLAMHEWLAIGAASLGVALVNRAFSRRG